MATMASAALQISVNGSTAIDDITIDMTASETVIIGLATDAVITPGVGEWFGAAITGLMTGVSFDSLSAVSAYPTEGGIALFASAAVDLGYPVPALEDGTGFTVTLGTIPSVAIGDIYTGIVLSGLAAGDYVLTLTGSMDYMETTFQDSVMVHVTPEPMTMALLGLGGLFIRRRK